MGLVISEVTRTSRPPSWLVMLPQKFSAATTWTTAGPAASEAPATAPAPSDEVGAGQAEHAGQEGESGASMVS